MKDMIPKFIEIQQKIVEMIGCRDRKKHLKANLLFDLNQLKINNTTYHTTYHTTCNRHFFKCPDHPLREAIQWG